MNIATIRFVNGRYEVLDHSDGEPVIGITCENGYRNLTLEEAVAEVKYIAEEYERRKNFINEE